MPKGSKKTGNNFADIKYVNCPCGKRLTDYTRKGIELKIKYHKKACDKLVDIIDNNDLFLFNIGYNQYNINSDNIRLQ